MRRPKGQHSQGPDITALISHGGTSLVDITIWHPLSRVRLANAPREACPLPVLKAAWAPKVARFREFISQTVSGHSLLPVPISTIVGWHPEAHRAFASGIASRAMTEFDSARSTFFQPRAALLASNNG